MGRSKGHKHAKVGEEQHSAANETVGRKSGGSVERIGSAAVPGPLGAQLVVQDAAEDAKVEPDGAHGLDGRCLARRRRETGFVAQSKGYL